MKTGSSLSFGQMLLCGLLVGAAFFIFDAIVRPSESDQLEDMTIEDLTDLMNDKVQVNTSESYLEAAKIRDLIDSKRKILNNEENKARL